MKDLPKILWLVAAGILVLATFRLPYGYYTFTRIAICAFCALVAYYAWSDKAYLWAVPFTLVGILFNPIIPVYLNRQTWFWLDIGCAGFILAHLGYRYWTERPS